jgi:folate-dependent phosphoribosylglycinamide formyltransferase PurN
MLNIGWLSTGRGEGSRGLLQFVQDRISTGSLNAKIEFVFSNREPGEAEGSDEFFDLVRHHGLPLVTYSSSKFRRSRGGRWADHRDEYHQGVMDRLSRFSSQICVLAGYMLIVSGDMCRAYSLLNLHPALPDGPIGTWQEVIWRLIETRSPQTGAMIHLATEDVDRGPVVSYCTVPIAGPIFSPHWEALHGQDLGRLKETQGESYPLFRLIRRVEYQREPYLLSETLAAVSSARILIGSGTALDQVGRPLAALNEAGLCLDPEIGQAMAGDRTKTVS